MLCRWPCHATAKADSEFDSNIVIVLCVASARLYIRLTETFRFASRHASRFQSGATINHSGLNILRSSYASNERTTKRFFCESVIIFVHAWQRCRVADQMYKTLQSTVHSIIEFGENAECTRGRIFALFPFFDRGLWCL